MPRDPRERRHRAPDVDHLAAAVRLEASLQAMRDRPDDEPPTGLIDLNAIRALLGQPVTADPDPAAAAWLAGGADPAAARMVSRIDRITSPEPVLEVAFGELYDEEPPHACNPDAEGVCTDCGLRVVEEPAVDVDRVHDLAAQFLAAAGHDVQVEVAPCPVPVPPGPSPAVLPPPPAEPAPLSDHTGPLLTWRSRHDDRSRGYGIRAAIAGSAPLTDRLWPVGPVGNQGAEGACVGWGLVDAVNARAAGDRDLTAADASAIYARAQQLDDVPGEAYSGTSVLAGMKAAAERGLISGYRWCFGTRDVAQAVLQRGPVVIGVPWLSGMYDTGPGGLVQLEGEDTGAGHCLAVVGLLIRGPQQQMGPYFVWQNSWGPDYGDGGLGYIHHRDLAQLLHGTGEAAVPS